MRIAILFSLILLAGCETNPVKPEPIVVQKIKYEIKLPPAKLLTLPPAVSPLNVDDPSLKQSDVSSWLKAKEDRAIQIENQLIGIGEFFKTEQQKLDEQAKKETK